LAAGVKMIREIRNHARHLVPAVFLRKRTPCSLYDPTHVSGPAGRQNELVGVCRFGLRKMRSIVDMALTIFDRSATPSGFRKLLLLPTSLSSAANDFLRCEKILEIGRIFC
jgi:hypothetical protein